MTYKTKIGIITLWVLTLCVGLQVMTPLGMLGSIVGFFLACHHDLFFKKVFSAPRLIG